MNEKGIIVGCDSQQEWLLSWWWEHYHIHNEYPIVFIDFGMTEQALAWCRTKGECMDLPALHPDPASKTDVLPQVKELWETRYGEEIWSRRNIWFKKPSALLRSPFRYTIWLDLDCQVNASLEPLFHCLYFGIDIALVKEPDYIQALDQYQQLLLPGEIHYNSGVLAYQQHAAILHQWAELALRSSEQFSGDQQALSRAIHLYHPQLFELPSIYNWSCTFGPNTNAKIHHFHSDYGKKEIKKYFNSSS
ncbi:MAG: hypothetical protein KGZ30_02210 [Anaplasmataceae bacterium]|nr:hypothetical protein [Anaplasmataceae bacterium]